MKSPETIACGPIHELDPGRYRAVIRDGVPMIERGDTAGAVTAVVVPISLELLDELSADWSNPVRFRIENGEFIFKTESAAIGPEPDLVSKLRRAYEQIKFPFAPPDDWIPKSGLIPEVVDALIISALLSLLEERSTPSRDGDKLAGWLREGANELEKAHAVLDHAEVPRSIPGSEPVECTLAARIWLLGEREAGRDGGLL